ncbi:MAG: hypothetical protein VB125_01000 [Burkholderia sp.]
MGSRERFPGNRSICSCRGAQPHDGTRSSAVRPYCLRSKAWESLRPYVLFMPQRPVTAQFATDRTRRVMQAAGHGPQLASLLKAQPDQRTLFTTQVFVGSHPT